MREFIKYKLFSPEGDAAPASTLGCRRLARRVGRSVFFFVYITFLGLVKKLPQSLGIVKKPFMGLGIVSHQAPDFRCS